MPTTRPFKWRVIAHCERGASHIRSDSPNQDAVQSFTSFDGRPPIVLAIADGHGSPRSFRSDIGSRVAVDQAVSLCVDFLRSIGDTPPSAIKYSAEQRLPREIIDSWRRQVTQHFMQNPFSLSEAAVLPPADYLVAYGTTLLIVAISDNFLLYFQIGDGEILEVWDATGAVVRAIPRDDSLIANETTSLCMHNPLPAIRFKFQYFPASPPGMILLTTDGYPNSFRTQEGFFKVGTDILEILRAEGADVVERDLPAWLQEASAVGSGDDVTVGIIWRSEPPLSQAAARASTALAANTPGPEPLKTTESSCLPDCQPQPSDGLSID